MHFIDYINLQTIRAGEVPMNIYISDLSAIQFSETPTSSLLDPFIGHTRSLEFQLYIQDTLAVAASRAKVCCLIAKCLGANKGPLKRLVLNVVTSPHQQLFMESVSAHTDPKKLTIDLSHELLEGALYSVAHLWLGGLYFNWGSKVYHGLTALRLDVCQPGPSSISEAQLINILASSPQLRYLNIDLDIIQQAPSPSTTRLPELEALVGDVSLLKLVCPGTKELSLSIIGQPERDSGALYNSWVQDFLSCANITTFLGDTFLQDATELCYLLSVAPHIQALALTEITLTGALPEIGTYPSLDVLYLLGGCELDWALLRQTVEIWRIKKLILWGDNHIVRNSSRLIDSEEVLEEVLLDLNISLEFVPRIPGGASPMDLFIGPTFN